MFRPRDRSSLRARTAAREAPTGNCAVSRVVLFRPIAAESRSAGNRRSAGARVLQARELVMSRQLKNAGTASSVQSTPMSTGRRPRHAAALDSLDTDVSRVAWTAAPTSKAASGA